jgi:hypothetical protein
MPKAISSSKINKTPRKGSLPNVPNTRQSEPNSSLNNFGLGSQYGAISLNELRTAIPIIRNLMVFNSDVGQAIHNIVTLGNTGHKVFFDKRRTPEEIDAMRRHLKNRSKEWASGQAGPDGLVNRFISQILIGGALSAEWVPNADLTGIESVIMVGPEEVEFKLDARTTKYIPFQIAKQLFNRSKKSDSLGLIPLNPNTYKYFALNGDGELPYGFPPYISVLPRVSTQGRMDKNINFVIDQMGLMGFIEALIQKPDPNNGEDSGEGITKYEQRLDALLEKAKSRMLSGFKDGVVVGFKDDHEFKFNSASKAYSEAVSLYENNELMLASSLKQDASMWGRAYSTSETQITVVFIKMLSELRNIHNLIAQMLQFGYALELRLAGFQFDSLEVKFNKSTIQDDLKSQQAEEIKIRNVKDKMVLGMISQDTAADELGYEVPDSPEPRVPWEILAGGSLPKPTDGPLEADKAKKKADTKKKKTASATKQRRQGKILPK